MLRAQRQQHAIVVGRGLELEIEAAAKPFSQGQAPGPVDARAQRRVYHELHAPRFVEEPLEDNFFQRGHQPDGGQLRFDVAEPPAPAPQGVAPHSACNQPRACCVIFRIRRLQRDGHVLAELGKFGRELRRGGPAARPARTGCSAGAPSASFTITSPPARARCATTYCPIERCRQPGFRWQSPRRPCPRTCPQAGR